MPWETDPVKRAMSVLVRFLDRFAVRVPEDSSLVATAENPDWRRRFLETRLHLLPYEKLLGLVGRRLVGTPTLVTDREWDALVVLDACRHDVFCHVVGRDVPSIASPGTDTIGWVKANFVRNPNAHRVGDVVLVSANPYLSREYFRLQDWAFPFAEGYSLWKSDWDEARQTVLPRAVVEAAARVAGRDDRRLLVHFIQPHFPPIGEHGFETHDMAVPRRDVMGPAAAPPGADAVWGLLKRDDLSLEEGMALYEENLRVVLPWALGLARCLDGRVVVTSDHGNLFGEYGLYWHPSDLWVPELCRVPWLELEGGGEGPEAVAKASLEDVRVAADAD